jgi:hypothetical protein
LVPHRDETYESPAACERHNSAADGAKRSHALAEIDIAKWRLWNGLTERGIIGLVHLGQWAQAECFAHIPSLNKLSRMLSDTIRYLELNADSMPDYGKRYRAGQRISTGFVESAVNEIVAKRMVKKQQMRWNRYTVQSFLDVRIHVLNGTLEDTFRHWHKGFRPLADKVHRYLSMTTPQLEHAVEEGRRSRSYRFPHGSLHASHKPKPICVRYPSRWAGW